MSFLGGSLAGVVVAGGVYYGFSNLIHSRTAQHRGDMAILTDKLNNASTYVPSPPPASTYIRERPFGSLVESRWNEEVAKVFAGASRLEQRAAEWSRKLLYGGDSS